MDDRFAILTTWFGTLRAETTNHFNKAPAYAAQGKEQEFYYEYNNGIPGHMTKARRMMQEDIKLIDIVIELVDARLPLASKNSGY